jgi:hypothetical protein
MSRRLMAVAAALAIGAGLSGAEAFAASLGLNSQSLASLRSCVVTATPSSTTVVLDASLRQASATSNFGTDPALDVTSANGANRRLYLKFDLASCNPTIPTTATVRLATLRLYASALPGNCRTLDIFRVPTSWTEAGLSWNNEPFGATINNPAQASRTDSFDVGTPGNCQNKVVGYVTGAIVSSDVAAFVSGTANYGWMIRDDSEGSNQSRTSTFSAKELGTLAQAPQLVISYVVTP